MPHALASNLTNLITVDGLVVSKLTGEIHGHDGKTSIFSTPTTAQPSLSDCRSMDDFTLHLKDVDRRKLPAHTLHQLRNEVDSARGEWYRTGVDCRITLPQQRLLEKLHQLVIYHNAIFMTQTDLAKALNVDESNLMKKLKVLEQADILRTYTSRNSNIRSREIKLTINPRLIFRGNDQARGRYIADWYKPASHLRTSVIGTFEMNESISAAA
jgi:DNA-binding MarR family transcriptional regulator